jgi:dienelactone hydrolase
MGASSSSQPNASAQCAEEVVGSSVASVAEGTVRNGFAPNTGIPVGAPWRGPDGELISLPTCDGKALAAMYVDAQSKQPSPPGVILFHGNGMTHVHMGKHANVYHAIGVSVLAVTLRGYDGSEQGDGSVAEDGEAGMYLDAAAAVDFMLARGFVKERLVAHGFSLGGSMAAAAACHHRLGGLVLDHTFASALAETAHVGKELMGLTWAPDWLLRGIGRGGFKPGVQVDLGAAGVVVTDGLASVDKVKTYTGRLVIIYGDADHLMPNSFADDFDAAYASSGGKATRIMIPGGGHECSYLQDDATVRRVYEGLASVIRQ